jgi:hypothetical protein
MRSALTRIVMLLGVVEITIRKGFGVTVLLDFLLR